MDKILKTYSSVIIFDCETTGFDPSYCQIIELAAIKLGLDSEGNIIVEKEMDDFIRLPEGKTLPGKIIELTGITDEMLLSEGIDESLAANHFLEMAEGDSLLIAHNAQFDAAFLRKLISKCTSCPDFSYIDSMTVYKDRRAYPHKLSDAIIDYGLTGKVQNSHRAIDDVMALLEIIKCMHIERSDIHSYVNIFGYNPKYGVSGTKVPGVTYAPQRFNDSMASSDSTLPAIIQSLN